jgi:hypothetical protein
LQRAMQSAPGQVNSILQARAATLAYNDVFLITGCLLLLFVPTAMLLCGAKPEGHQIYLAINVTTPRVTTLSR